MITSRTMITFAFGIGIAAVAVYLVEHRIRVEAPATLPATARSGPETVPVVVAKTALSFGDRLNPPLLQVVAWPANSRPQGTFESIEQLIGPNDQARAVLRPIVAGEPILESRVTGPGMRASMSLKLPDSMRAIALPINDVSGVAGFVLPGDRVDVVLTRSIGERENLVADVILQNVLVLGIDQVVDEGREQPKVGRTVTVAVATEDAQKLALAQQIGTLSLALRHVNAVGHQNTSRVAVADLVSERPTPARPTPRQRTVMIRRGTKPPVPVAVP